MRAVVAAVVAPCMLAGCQPPDDAALIFDASDENFFVAQWGDWRRGWIACPEGFVEDTKPSAKPSRADTRIAQNSIFEGGQVEITEKRFGIWKYHRSEFFKCSEQVNEVVQ